MCKNIGEKGYLTLLENILSNGEKRNDRTGVGTSSIFGAQLKFDLSNNKIPLMTTKRMFYKGIIEELLFFLRGESDTKILENKGVKIWKGNTTREFLDKKGLSHLPEGNMGKMYGKQWRDWGGTNNKKGIDQIDKVISLIKNDPNSRRITVSALNVGELDEMVLDPCHPLFQFYVNDDRLSCLFFMRSVDMFLGFPFNVASYGILTHIIAKVTGLKGDKLIFMAGDAHVYNNHQEQVKEQISRIPYKFPTLLINKELSSIENIEELQFKDFKIEGYKYHQSIKAEMAV